MTKPVPATASTPAWAQGLSDKETAFVLQYMVDLNLKNAGVRAGLGKTPASAAVLARKMRDKPAVAEAISKLLQERHGIQGAKIVSTLWAIAYVDAVDFFEIKNGHVTIKDSSTWSPEMRAAISEIWESNDSDGRTIIRLKFHDKIGALDRLGKSIGLFKKKSEQTVHHTVELADPMARIKERLASLRRATVDAEPQIEIDVPVKRAAIPAPRRAPPMIDQ
jgi:phage terminase small subunit